MCSAEYPAIIDEIIKGIHRITCRNLTKLQNDATACFDHMVTLNSRLHQVPDKVCKLQASVLQQMKYRIIAFLETSQTFYSNTKQTPLHGTGQCSGSSGSNWIFTSASMMKTIEQKCKDVKLLARMDLRNG